ncbi:hypothetical protein B0H13DRAFT_2229362 [Mycena leptocephala]|nr:hypothetical protein B0H13DRAFT_2229362 [Mycena leptocephala]
MNATHAGDGAFVMLKRISKKDLPFEVEIGTWFSAEAQRSDPENHCVPIREVLQSPHDSDIHFHAPIPKLRQGGGLRYMHQHHVAHRDCARLNIMMDGLPMYSTPMHPVINTKKRDCSGNVSHRSRTQCPVKYYLTDFGISRRYNPEGLQSLAPTNLRQNCDPFPTDVYYLGNLIKEGFSKFTSRKLGFEFIEPLVADMINKDPSKRPTMDEVVDRLDKIVGGLNKWKMRSEVLKESQSLRFFTSISH